MEHKNFHTNTCMLKAPDVHSAYNTQLYSYKHTTSR